MALSLELSTLSPPNRRLVLREMGVASLTKELWGLASSRLAGKEAEVLMVPFIHLGPLVGTATGDG